MKNKKISSDASSHADYETLADWLEIVRDSLEREQSLSEQTQSELEDGLWCAEAALRRALAEKNAYGDLN